VNPASESFFCVFAFLAALRESFESFRLKKFRLSLGIDGFDSSICTVGATTRLGALPGAKIFLIPRRFTKYIKSGRRDQEKNIWQRTASPSNLINCGARILFIAG
jgi:hypothetical protein